MKSIFIYGDKDEAGNVKTEGAVARGVPAEVADDIFEEMTSFAQYAFNKSHAAAYAVIAYQTAYLKHYYPQEFLAAILNDRIDKIDEITKYVIYLKERGIPVLQPDINHSKAYFSVEGKGVRFGLVGVKGVGLGAIETIVEERKQGGEFKSFEDFMSRANVKVLNKRLIENLIYAGAFDCFKIARSRLIAVYEGLMDRAVAIAKERDSNQLSLFSGALASYNDLTVKYPDIAEYDDKTRLSKERDVLGVYVTGHPLTRYMDSFAGCSFTTELLQYYEEDEDGIRSYTEIKDGQRVEMGGIITAASKKITKNGQSMGMIVLEDVYGGIECVFFPKVYDRVKSLIRAEAIVKIEGKLQIREGQKPSISVDKLKEIELKEDGGVQTESGKPSGMKSSGKQECMAVIIPEDKEEFEEEIFETLSLYPGDVQVYIKKGGLRYKANYSIRNCRGLLSELVYFVGENNVIFFEK